MRIRYRILSLFAILMLTMGLTGCSIIESVKNAYFPDDEPAAVEEDGSKKTSGTGYLSDKAKLLTKAERGEIETELEELSDKYGWDFVIASVKKLDGGDIVECADNYYEENGYGRDAHNSGVLFMLAFEERSWCISTAGDAVQAFDDSILDGIETGIVGYLGDEDYYGAFECFISMAQSTVKDYVKAGESEESETAAAGPDTGSEIEDPGTAGAGTGSEIAGTETPEPFERPEYVSDSYEYFEAQASPAQVYADYLAKGYTSVRLVSHYMSSSDTKNSDIICAELTYSDPDGCFTITNYANIKYTCGASAVWTDEGITDYYADDSCDVSGMNGTYWKVRNVNNVSDKSLMLSDFFYYPDAYMYAVDDYDFYIGFDGIGSRSSLGTILLYIDGNVYSRSIPNGEVTAKIVKMDYCSEIIGGRVTVNVTGVGAYFGSLYFTSHVGSDAYADTFVSSTEMITADTFNNYSRYAVGTDAYFNDYNLRIRDMGVLYFGYDPTWIEGDPPVEEQVSEWFFYDSDYRYLTFDDLYGMTKEQCRFARNEIFARHGRKFSSNDLQEYFNSCSWYVPLYEPDEFSSSLLNSCETANVDLIKSYEELLGD